MLKLLVVGGGKRRQSAGRDSGHLEPRSERAASGVQGVCRACAHLPREAPPAVPWQCPGTRLTLAVGTLLTTVCSGSRKHGAALQGRAPEHPAEAREPWACGNPGFACQGLSAHVSPRWTPGRGERRPESTRLGRQPGGRMSGSWGRRLHVWPVIQGP